MVIGSLVTNIVADLSKWGPNLDKARGKMATFVRDIGKLQAALAVVTAGVVAGFVKSLVDAGGALDDASKKLQINVESLQRYRFALSQIGVGQGAADKSLAFLNKTIGKAATGSTAATQAFSALGLSVNTLVGQGLDDSFIQVLEAINRLPTAAQQASAAVAIFGKQGQDLLQAARNMKEFREQMDRINPVTGQAIEQLDRTGDVLNEVTTNLKNLGMELVGTFGPFINILLGELQRGIERIRWTANLIREILRDMRGYTIQPPAQPQRRFGAQGVPLPAIRPATPQLSLPIRQPTTPAMSGSRPGIRPNAPDIVVFHQLRDANRGLTQVMNLLPGRLQLAINNALGRGPSLGPLGPLVSKAGGLLSGAGGLGGMIGRAFAAPFATGQLGSRVGPLEALRGGTREAYIASRENMRPRMQAAAERQLKHAEKQTTLQEKIEKGIGNIANAVTNGVSLIGGSIGN